MVDFGARLCELAARSLLRRRRVVDTASGPETVVDGRRLIAFCSNDYLGLASHPRLRAAAIEGIGRWGVGSGASHLVSGHTEAHARLEARLSAFVGMPRALYFSTGYAANIGAITALAGRGDAVFSDALNHASLIDAIRLSGAERHIYPHSDLDALERALSQSGAEVKLVVTDAVFSMDGDLAPLPEILRLCERHDALLLVDDAHGFGVLGQQGRGALAHFGLASPRILYVGTLGKAAGVSGAFVAGQEEAIEWLVQRARTYIYTTASPPLLAEAVCASIELIETGEERRSQLRTLVARLRGGLDVRRWRLLDSAMPIQPLVIGGNDETLRVSAALLEAGLWVPAIRPPTVPSGAARLRITLSAAHRADHLDRLVETLNALGAGA